MPLRVRQIIFIFLALVFIILTPGTIFYTAGYRYNFNKKMIEKTGALVLDSIPKRARVLLNERDAHKVTPARFPRLLPGEYRVRLEKEGYHPWEKNLLVESRRTTFAADVLFLKKTSPEIASPKQIKMITPSPQGDYVAMIAISEKSGIQELWVWDFKREPNLRFTTDSEIADISWSPQQKNLLIRSGGNKISKFYILPKDEGGPITIAPLTGQEWKSVVWSEGDDNELFGASSGEGASHLIYRLHLENKKLKTKKIGVGGAAIWHQNSRVYSILPGRDGARLLEFKNDEITTPEIIAVLKNGSYSFLNSPARLLTIIKKGGGNLYVVKPEFNESIVFQKTATFAVWSLSKKQLLISDDFEVSVYNPDKNSLTFITRYGQQIKKTLWLSSDAHILLQFNDAILGIELDSRSSRYSPTLVSGHDISDLFLTDETKTAFFTAAASEGKRLFKLPLQ